MGLGRAVLGSGALGRLTLGLRRLRARDDLGRLACLGAGLGLGLRLGLGLGLGLGLWARGRARARARARARVGARARARVWPAARCATMAPG